MVNWGEYSFSVPILLLGWLTGQGVRRWHELSRSLRRHLDDVSETEQARAAAAVADERARIARELHDVVAHAVSVMVVQAGSARLGMAEDPVGSADALRNVEETGRQALVEMRHMLGLLRAADAVPSLAPQPTLRALPALVGAARSAGQDVDLQMEGVPVPLPPGLDLSAYRIVQEALTNAFRHAGAVPVAVRVRYGRADLALEITNGAAAAPPERPGRGTGHGLIGMRERTELFGGSLTTGRTADGGFAVRAVLPLPEPPPHVPAPADRSGTVLA
jgi:signal transduction histidine kinase